MVLGPLDLINFSFDFKLIQFDIVQSVFVKGIFHLILYIVQRDQYKFTQYDNKIGKTRGVVQSYFVDDGWGINDGKQINKNQTIGFETDGSSVGMDGN